MPNVGKSALFNRMAKKRIAIVYDRPGVTRDCRALTVTLPDSSREICLIDTPGVPPALMGAFGRRASTSATRAPDDLDAIMLQQTLQATKEADALLFLFDGKTALDKTAAEFFQRARTFNKPLLAIVNKCDTLKERDRLNLDAYALGIEPLFISAEHGEGIRTLIETLETQLEALEEERENEEEEHHEAPLEEEWNAKEAGQALWRPSNTSSSDALDAARTPSETPLIVDADNALDAADSDALGNTISDDRVLNLAIIGRPNVGKSTLVNALLRRPAQIVADVPGVTRDAVDFDWVDHGRRFRLTDTAGIRRRARVRDDVEKISVSQAFNALNFAHVVVVVVDAEELEQTDYGEMLQQDLLLAARVMEEGRCAVLALNKWDRVKEKGRLKRAFAESLTFASDLKDVPVVMMSASQGLGLSDLLKRVREVEEAWNRRVPTARMNAWLRETLQRHPPKGTAAFPPKLKYMAQVGSRPPQFVIFGTRTDTLAENYKRFLINQLKNAFGLEGLPVRLQIRQQANPYESKGRRKRRR